MCLIDGMGEAELPERIDLIGPVSLEGDDAACARFNRLALDGALLVRTPALRPMGERLRAGFPHAGRALDRVLSDLEGRPHVRWRPTLFVGPPGSGKTTLARALCEALGLHVTVYGCGAIGDASLLGTSRHWSSARPSLVLELIERSGSASPAIVLDEVDKVASGKHNGHLYDGLAGLLEPSSAQRFWDPFLEASVDASHVIWIATANDATALPTALRDRCRILHVPAPGAAHLDALSVTMLRDIVQERGLHPDWGRPLDGAERLAVSERWSGGSLRALRRFLEAVVWARDAGPVLQ